MVAYMAFVMSTLFVQGMRMVAQEINNRDIAMISGLSFLMAMATQSDAFKWGQSALVVGGVCALSFSLLRELIRPSRQLKNTTVSKLHHTDSALSRSTQYFPVE